jgi:hypothetical protein
MKTFFKQILKNKSLKCFTEEVRGETIAAAADADDDDEKVS